MTRARMLAAFVVLLALAPVGAAKAEAQQIAFAPCPGEEELQCGRLAVPLDHSGRLGGTLDLAVYRAPATGRARGVLLGFPGGPGDAGLAYFRRRLDGFALARATHDLVFFDPRGTGASGALRCGDADRCAATLGPAKSLYTSRDIADDAEAVRRALGVERMALYGISYGTWFAQSYARRHPSRVSALVLDAVVSLGAQSDPFHLSTFRSIRRAVRAICGAGACRGITADAFADLVALLRRIQRDEVRGADAIPLVLALTNLDVNPPLRAELPAAVAAARDGDLAPLLRLVEGGTMTAPDDPAKFSTAANLVTQCEEVAVPWERTTPFEVRGAEAHRRAEAVPERAFAPLSRELGLLNSTGPLCERWPAGPDDPLVRGPLPSVPALVLAGDADLRTPAIDAAETARSIPGARLMTVRNSGHGALVEEPTGCAARAVAALLAGAPAPRACRRTGLLPRPAFPRRLRDIPVRAVRGETGTRARVIAAAAMTTTDALNHSALRMDAARLRLPSVRFGGLRGGSVSGIVGRADLDEAAYVEGVRVTGRATAAGRHDLRVRGSVSGRLRIRGSRVTGTLGGRRVTATLSPRAVGAAGVRVERVL